MSNAAVIVLYNPELKRLDENISAIIEQVDKLYLVDNHSTQDIYNRVEEEYLSNRKIRIVRLSKNCGIAAAINVALKKCVEEHIEWLLTLDQDSVCPSNLIEDYSKYINKRDVAIICCAIQYNGIELSASSETGYRYIEKCITSASYMNVTIADELKGLDEYMFIDRVDFEYCFRVREAGYKILQDNDVCLNHELGNLSIYKLGKNKVHVGNHSAGRKYYMARNSFYLHQKHPKEYTLKECSIVICKLILKTIIYETDKINKLKRIMSGVRDGILISPFRK
ncbi:glycosyltransferase family 2 protein [Bifidobacterium moukalabense]|uniref:glycosyltransferase family 2 protein n=1 Tax=Bifidobacterium moukalabense TaxID=1333651 RepID=UPI0010F769E9|nr:glycosyltransferase family 2 protein [Bifidobacterium moukalabense]